MTKPYDHAVDDDDFGDRRRGRRRDHDGIEYLGATARDDDYDPQRYGDEGDADYGDADYPDADYDSIYRNPDPYAVPEVDVVLGEAIDMVAQLRPLPMSSTVKVNRDELLDLLEEAQARLPEELRAARWLLKERDEFLERAAQERDEIIAEGRDQVARMVERQEVVKAADARARQIIEDAKTDARQMRRQVEDFCDQRLASFEIILDKLGRTVAQGRERLLGTSAADQLADLSGISGDRGPEERRRRDEADSLVDWNQW